MRPARASLIDGELGSVNSNLERLPAKTIWSVSPGATVAKVLFEQCAQAAALIT